MAGARLTVTVAVAVPLSRVASTWPGPLVFCELYVVEAKPELRFVDAAPNVAPLGNGSVHFIGRPAKASRFAAPMAPPSESVVSAAVMVEVAFGPTRVAGPAVAI